MRTFPTTFPAEPVIAGIRRLMLLACMVGMTAWHVQAQSDGFCCDPNFPEIYDGANCQEFLIPDPDCTSIPLDGGLGLLALAGGGLATAAIRRRKEAQEADSVKR